MTREELEKEMVYLRGKLNDTAGVLLDLVRDYTEEIRIIDDLLQEEDWVIPSCEYAPYICGYDCPARAICLTYGAAINRIDALDLFQGQIQDALTEYKIAVNKAKRYEATSEQGEVLVEAATRGYAVTTEEVTPNDAARPIEDTYLEESAE